MLRPVLAPLPRAALARAVSWRLASIRSCPLDCTFAGVDVGLVLAATPSCLKNSASLIVVELRGIEGAAMVSAESVELWDELTSDEIDCEITALSPTAAMGYGIMG